MLDCIFRVAFHSSDLRACQVILLKSAFSDQVPQPDLTASDACSHYCKTAAAGIVKAGRWVSSLLTVSSDLCMVPKLEGLLCKICQLCHRQQHRVKPSVIWKNLKNVRKLELVKRLSTNNTGGLRNINSRLAEGISLREGVDGKEKAGNVKKRL